MAYLVRNYGDYSYLIGYNPVATGTFSGPEKLIQD
jgi:hypothetical protein